MPPGAQRTSRAETKIPCLVRASFRGPTGRHRSPRYSGHAIPLFWSYYSVILITEPIASLHSSSAAHRDCRRGTATAGHECRYLFIVHRRGTATAEAKRAVGRLAAAYSFDPCTGGLDVPSAGWPRPWQQQRIRRRFAAAAANHHDGGGPSHREDGRDGATAPGPRDERYGTREAVCFGKLFGATAPGPRDRRRQPSRLRGGEVSRGQEHVTGARTRDWGKGA